MFGFDIKKGDKWMLPVLPAYVASGPLATLIPLYIISIGGGILDVSYAITLASAVTIPSVIFWGYIADYYNKRKALIVMSYLTTTLLLASLFFINTPIGIMMVYTALAFVGAATAAPINLLVTEHSKGDKALAPSFTMLQVLSNFGISVGLLFAWIISGFFSLKILIIALTIPSLASTILATRMIKEPPLRLRIRINRITESAFSLIYRVVALPNVIISIPSQKNFRYISNFFRLKTIIGLKRKFIVVFYVISFVFFFGTALFNTEYPVALKLGGITASNIFLIYLAAISIQGVVFYYYGAITKNRNYEGKSIIALLGRGAMFVAVGLVFIFVTGFPFFAANMLLYIIGVGIAYGIYYPATYFLFFRTLHKGNRGSAIGTYSAVIGAGTLLGALASGTLSVTYGFANMFFMSGALMIACAALFKILPRR
ncbi:MAG: MFS transporter [Candidatus Micrarchaeota archaeon]|nr:MFS transporter [Candidatus Micrarchaeota archaeon]MDE1833738.1 MFS transporter [Candidatus Micrarchaeota archaeon]MDE1859629.1 MFS transporter [Candidatus Micrarchaeota archaeon]